MNRFWNVKSLSLLIVAGLRWENSLIFRICKFGFWTLVFWGAYFMTFASHDDRFELKQSLYILFEKMLQPVANLIIVSNLMHFNETHLKMPLLG